MAQARDSKPGFRRPMFSRRPQRPRKPLRPPVDTQHQRDDEKLDEALRGTFPASDPAVSTPRKS